MSNTTPTLNTENCTIENVTFFYAKLKSPSFKYQSNTEKEYSVTALVDKPTAKAWNKQFQKQKAKEVDYDEFVEKYGAEFAIGDEEQFLITLKKPAQYKDGNPIKENQIPRAFIDSGDGELEDITFTTLIGNGSKGVIQYDVTSNDYGTFAKLAAIKVDELVVVEEAGGAGRFNVLGKVKSLADNPNKGEVVASSETASTNTPDDDDVPF